MIVAGFATAMHRHLHYGDSITAALASDYIMHYLSRERSAWTRPNDVPVSESFYARVAICLFIFH